MKRPTAWTYSASHQSLGLFLLFLAMVTLLPVPALLAELEIGQARSLLWVWLPTALACGGLYLSNFTRKRFWVEPGQLRVRDGLSLSSRVYHWEGVADIALHSYEDQRGEWWLVDLVCGKPRYTLHKSLDHCQEMRHLAATLTRATGGSLLENEAMVIPRGELDLPLPERLQLHPQLLGPEWEQPHSSRVALQEAPDRLHFRWKHPWSHILPFFFSLALVILILASAPLFPGETPEQYSEWRGAKFQHTAWEMSRQGDYSYFWLSGAFLALATLAWAGVRQELVFTPERAMRRVRTWGIPVSAASLEVREIREIWARTLNYGCDFEVVGEDKQLGGWMSDPASARWIVARVLRFYARRCKTTME